MTSPLIPYYDVPMNITGNALNTPADETIFGAFGEFETFAGPETDEEWAEYDRMIADEMAKADAEAEDTWIDLDGWGEDR